MFEVKGRRRDGHLDAKGLVTRQLGVSLRNICIV